MPEATFKTTFHLLLVSNTRSLAWHSGRGGAEESATTHAWATTHTWATRLEALRAHHARFSTHGSRTSTAEVVLTTHRARAHAHGAFVGSTEGRAGLALRGRSTFDDAVDTVPRLVVILGVYLLHEFDVFDELLVGALARLDREVGRVRLNRLHVGLDESVDLYEGEKRAHGDPADVHKQGSTFFLDTDHLIEDADF